MTETWSDGHAEGWTGVGTDMTVTYSGVAGLPPGSLSGTFGSQAIPASEVGAFHATGAASGGGFTGDYWSDVPGWTGWTFNFLAADILPSSVQLRLHGNGWTAWYNVTAQINNVGQWQSVSVPSVYTAAWVPPGNEVNWSNALSAVEWIEVQVARAGEDEQSYFLDNFRIAMNELGGSAAIPEPDYALMMALFMLMLLRGVKSRAEAERRGDVASDTRSSAATMDTRFYVDQRVLSE